MTLNLLIFMEASIALMIGSIGVMNIMLVSIPNGPMRLAWDGSRCASGRYHAAIYD